VTIIPRKFSNSKGNNFFTEVQNAKRLNRLMRELKTNKEVGAHRDNKKQYSNNKNTK
jgi:hypothetical protein